MRFLFSFFLLISVSSTLMAQQFLGLGSVWSDDFEEWKVYVDSLEGELRTTWRGDFTEWKYELSGELYGTIRMKWKGDPSQWEIRGSNGELISARPIWPNNLREWRLTDNSMSLEIKPRWGNQMNEWLMNSRQYGSLYFYQDWENDPREWTVEDECVDVSPHMKMGMIFMALLQTITQ